MERPDNQHEFRWPMRNEPVVSDIAQRKLITYLLTILFIFFIFLAHGATNTLEAQDNNEPIRVEIPGGFAVWKSVNVKLSSVSENSRSARIDFSGVAENQSGKHWHTIAFCITASDVNGTRITNDKGDPCLIKANTWDFGTGTAASFRASNIIKFSEKQPLAVPVGSYAILYHLGQSGDRPPPTRTFSNERIFDRSCEDVWSVLVPLLIRENNFQPKMADRAGGLLSVVWSGVSYPDSHTKAQEWTLTVPEGLEAITALMVETGTVCQLRLKIPHCSGRKFPSPC